METVGTVEAVAVAEAEEVNFSCCMHYPYRPIDQLNRSTIEFGGERNCGDCGVNAKVSDR